jgi:hypothetical protein
MNTKIFNAEMFAAESIADLKKKFDMLNPIVIWQ